MMFRVSPDTLFEVFNASHYHSTKRVVNTQLKKRQKRGFSVRMKITTA